MDVFNRTVRFNHLDALRLASREVEITVTDALIKFHVLRFEATFVVCPLVISRTRSSQPDLRIDIEQYCCFGPITIAHEIGHFLDKLERNAAPVSLIRHGRVEKTVADDHLSTLESRNDFLRNVLAAGC